MTKETRAKLFAHIENDAHLCGTYNLQGFDFAITTKEFRNYLQYREKNNLSFPESYLKIVEDMDYLIAINTSLNSIKEVKKTRELANPVAKKILSMEKDKRIFLPGGWSRTDVKGHQLVYQITRNENDYHFSVINSGDGIEFHEKKSALDKELYNPIMTWHFPHPTTENEKAELGFFIERLFSEQIIVQGIQRDAARLYNEILPSICHIGGELLKAKSLPDYVYTPGHHSGTCVERCLHQTLKLNSSSEKEYVHFIFDYKLYIDKNYVDECLNDPQPLTSGIKQLINLAIQNNLKIINNPTLFSFKEIESFAKELKTLEEKINTKTTSFKQQQIVAEKAPEKFYIEQRTTVAPTPTFSTPYANDNLILIQPLQAKNFLADLKSQIVKIGSLHKSAFNYYYLQQLVMSLPMDLSNPLYTELNSKNYNQFANHLDVIQEYLGSVQTSYLKDSQDPALNLMVLKIMTLQMTVHSLITKARKLPDFTPFVKVAIQTVVSNTTRNSFWATNHPAFNKTLIDLHNQTQENSKSHQDYYHYYKTILASNPNLDNKLQDYFKNNYGSTPLEAAIKKVGMQSLYLISLHFNNKIHLDSEFNPLIKIIKEHLDYESKLRAAINPFFKHSLSIQPRLDFLLHEEDKALLLYTPLFPSFIYFQELSDKLSKPSYTLEDSPALKALTIDTATLSAYKMRLVPKTANNIQLIPLDSENTTSRAVTQADISARDYLHLRSVPQYQIALTLDYFSRHMDKLANHSDQFYLEANLMQPGLLENAFKDREFLPQFEAFVKKGLRFFNKNGLYTFESVFFVRINFLVSRYLYLMDTGRGVSLLEAIEEQLTKQLSQPNEAEVVYVLQQYLFLTLVTKDNLSTEHFTAATEAYFYLQSHANPNKEKAVSHLLDLEKAKINYQITASKLPKDQIELTVKQVLAKHPATNSLTINRVVFPSYFLKNDQDETLEFNLFLGKLFEKKMARTSLPLTIKNHPLIKHLDLQDKQDCLMSNDETYLVLPDKVNEVRLFYSKDKLIVQKTWLIDGAIKNYELHALSNLHLAKQATPIHRASLPAILKDKSMDYWQDMRRSCGLFVKNNKPLYFYKDNQCSLLDENGYQTTYNLEVLDEKWYSILNAFESNEFILSHKAPNISLIQLARYNLNFIIDKDNKLKFEETDEQVIERPSFIPAATAGLTLKVGNYFRFIIPIARFYPTDVDLQLGDFYAMQHDTTGFIATTFLNQEWKKKPPSNTPLWDYQGSEKHASFRIENEELIADNVADALYLAYVYLSTHQPEKAWAVLEYCNTNFGGLTGKPDELQFIAWIYEPLPNEFPHAEKAYIDTPPYVACRLKALSLLSDYLLQDKNFTLTRPKINDTANSHYDVVQHENLTRFLTNLPQSIYKSFSQLQKMTRHLDHSFNLSTLERKRLLNYYHKDESLNNPKGALGYEWMCLSLETLQQEREALQARINTGKPIEADRKRFQLIDKRIAEMKPILSQSTILEQKPIDLSLPSTFILKKANLNQQTIEDFEKWTCNINIKEKRSVSNEQIMGSLSSDMEENSFIALFPTLFEVARNDNNLISNFCSKILITNRHIPLDKQDSNIPFLANVLYRTSKLNLNWLLPSETNFKTLLTVICDQSVPNIYVYQAKDVYADILAKPEDILKKERPKSRPLFTKNLEKTSLLKQVEIKRYLDKQNRQTLDELISNYRNLCKEGNDQIILADTEATAGKALLALEQAQKLFGQQLLENKILINLLQNLFKAVEKPIEEELKNSWCSILEFANQGPDEPEKKLAWNIEKQSRKRALLNKADLQSMFCRADLCYSVEKTGFNPELAQKLHHLIHEQLLKEIQAQLIKKMKKDLDQALVESNPYLCMQVLDCLAKKELPGLADPVTILLQKEEDILLRPRQITALDSLLKPKNEGRGVEDKIEKIRPGGGKTKVIIPIYAEKLAQGDNLLIFEFPTASVKTNYVDLNRLSQKLFGKRAYFFEFDRDSNCSPKRLEEIYNLFIEIMVYRCYMVTTGDSIQALELKYNELLLIDFQTRETDWAKQVYWLDKITNLLRHYADAFIDEVHLGLWFKKKLIYTIGEPNPISPALIQYSLALYSYIDSYFIHNASKLANDYEWTNFKQNLAKQIISDSHSPLNPFFNQALNLYGAEVQQELCNYLLGLAKTMPEAITHASSEDKAALAFFKQQISAVIQDTLCRKLNVNYGASELKHLSATESTLAIPYHGNMTPNEQSRFGHEFVAINNTIQMFLIKGISKELLADQVKAWQALARQELAQNSNLKHINETPTAKGFALLEANKWSLSDFDVNDEAQLSALHKQYKDNRSLQFTLLKERILTQIQQESGFLQSDSFNHCDIYRSTVGVSGTPGEDYQRLKFNYKASLGTDDYLVELLEYKNTVLSFYDYEDAKKFVKIIITNSQKAAQTRVIIDINATFTGIANIDVAKLLANFVQKNPNFFTHTLKYVLYFNEDQILCALDISNPKLSILITTSDEKEISRRLRCKPEERMTYYDQIHTLAMDIKQYKFANALVLMDENVHFNPFAQGNLRMRDINQEQTNELILPTRVKGISLKNLALRLKNNGLKYLPLDNLAAAKAEISNLMRRNALTMIQDLASEDAEKKALLAQHFICFLKETPSQDLFALYGAIATKMPISDIFDRYKKQLLELWIDCHKKAELELKQTTIKEMEVKLQELIDSAMPHCLKEYDELISSMGKEVQIQKMIQKQIERVELKAFFDAQLIEAKESNWSIYNLKGGRDNLTVKMNDFCNSKTLFSTRVRVSNNYARTYLGQTQSFNAFMKPVFLIWYHFETLINNEKVLEAIIVTPQEAKNISGFVNFNDWISTSQDTVVKGVAHKDITSQMEYQTLREQIRFFNGDFISLLEQETSLIWIQENKEEKLSFFESNLQAYRPGCELGLHQLKTALTQVNTEGFVYIANHPYANHSQTDWKSLYPKILPSHANDYKKTAEAFQYINKSWWMINLLNIGSIEQQFGLAINAKSYVNDHLQNLLGLKKLVNEIVNCEQPFLLHLGTQKPVLESFLGMSLASFYQRQSIKETDKATNPKWLDASLAAIKILRNHSAFNDNKDFFDLAFKQLAQAANTSKFLIKLIKEEDQYNPSMLLAILDSQYCNEEIMGRVINLYPNPGVMIGAELVKKCTVNLIDSLLKTSIVNRHLSALCEHNFLTTEHLRIILNKAVDSKPLYNIFTHTAADASLQEAIFQHKTCNADFIISLIGKDQLTLEHCLNVLARPKFATVGLLMVAAAKFKDSEKVQLAVLKDEKCSKAVISAVLRTEVFSPKIASELVRPCLDNDSELSNLLEKLFANYPNSTLEWDKVLIDIVEYSLLHQSGFNKQIKEIIIKYSKLISLTFAIFYFHKMGGSLFDSTPFYLPFEDMLKLADNDTLKKLASQKETGPLYEARLRLLFDKCQNHFDEFFKRKDIHFEVINSILQESNSQLNESQLLDLLDNIKDNSTSTLIYNYPNATEKVREKILQSANLSSEFILDLLMQKGLKDEELIKIASQINFDLNLLSTVITKSSNSTLLLTLVQKNHQTLMRNSSLIDTLIRNPELTPELAQLILKEDKEKCYFTQIAKIAFAKIKMEPQWDSCLIDLFQRLTLNSTAYQIKSMVVNNGTLLSTKSASQVLRIWGAQMEKYLNLENLRQTATEAELKVLLTPSCKLSETMEIWLASKCETKELISLYLGKSYFYGEALLKLSQQENLTSGQLETLANNAKTPELLEQIHNHMAAFFWIKEIVYSHPSLTSDLLGRLTIENESYETILKHPTAVDKNLLTHVALSKLSEPVFKALIKHPQMTDDILTIVIENSNFSCKFADLMLNNFYLRLHTLTEIIKKALKQSNLETIERRAWINTSQKALERYFQLYNKKDLLPILRQEQIQSPELGFVLHQHYGQRLIDKLPIERMLLAANFHQLSLLAEQQETGRLSNELLNSLAQNCNDGNLIGIFLERQDPDAESLKIILDKKLSYRNLTKALRHPNLTEADRDNWLESMRAWQTARKTELANGANNNLKLSASLDALRIKACGHAIKALNDDGYAPVAEAAITLYKKLHDNVESYLNYELSEADFKKSCKDAIETALPILGTHRGYKPILADIFNVLLNIVTFKFLWSNNWRFFEPKTETVETIDEFEKSKMDVLAV